MVQQLLDLGGDVALVRLGYSFVEARFCRNYAARGITRPFETMHDLHLPKYLMRAWPIII